VGEICTAGLQRGTCFGGLVGSGKVRFSNFVCPTSLSIQRVHSFDEVWFDELDLTSWDLSSLDLMTFHDPSCKNRYFLSSSTSVGMKEKVIMSFKESVDNLNIPIKNNMIYGKYGTKWSRADHLSKPERVSHIF